ncbi:MAG: ammonium transporter [Cyanobacteria bacterium]|nr:ammonium transporter [Cyanobacteriota bacterium]
MDKSLIDILWVLVCAGLVFLMQAGFLCLEAGSTRSKNTINVVIKNISDAGVSTLCFWLFGFGLMFGQTHLGWIGTTALAPEVGQGDMWPVAFFLFQAMFCSTAVTIVSGAVAERMRFNIYLAIALLVSGLIYPIFGHWAWNGLDVGASLGWLAALGFVDFAGSTVVHSVGGWVSLAAVLILGPRIGRFSKKRRSRFMGYDLPLALLGTMLLWFGWFGFNGGSVLALNAQVPGVIVNTLLAGSAGLVTPIAISVSRGRQVPVTSVMNGSLAGLVAITANCHVVNAKSAIVIGAIGCLWMLAAEAILERCHIDDAVGAIPVHLSAGIWGTLAVALFGNLELIGTGLSRPAQFGIQLVGITTAAAWAFGLTYLVLWNMNRRWPLRVRRRHEQIGLNMAEHGAVSDLVDLFTTMRHQERTGDLSVRAPVELFTPVGQIAARYNQVIAALEQALARTDAIVEQAIEAIITVSQRDLRIYSMNPAVTKIFGYSELALVNTPLTTLVSIAPVPTIPAEIDPLQQFLAKASQTATPYELTGCRRSGGTFPVEVTVAPLQIRKSDCYTLILRDITLRKQAEEALQAAEAQDLKTRQLESALKELQQTQLQLVHSEKMSSLGQLVAGVAHEINNPINFIYGNLSYVAEYTHDLMDLVACYQNEVTSPTSAIRAKTKAVDVEYLLKDLPKILTSMQVGAERITEIVKSLRDFSHAGSADLKRVDLHQGLDSTLTILTGRLKAQGDRPAIEVIRQYSDLPKVECYPGQLNQVFMNILTNAIDALEEKVEQVGADAAQPKIRLTTAMLADDHQDLEAHRVQVQISDNGVGIPDHVKARMMEPFFTTKTVGKGTGLGMAISYQIVVERHHGQLKCHSNQGQGTCFVIEIPLYQLPTEALVEVPVA